MVLDWLSMMSESHRNIANNNNIMFLTDAFTELNVPYNKR